MKDVEKPTLSELNAKLDSMFRLMDENLEDGQEQQALMEDWESTLMDRQKKIASYCSVYKTLVAKGEMIKAQAQSNLERGNRMLRKAEHVKNFLRMQMMDRELFETPEHKIKWRASTELEVTNENFVPDNFIKPQPPKIDRAGIKQWMGANNTEKTSFAVLIKKLNMSIG